MEEKNEHRVFYHFKKTSLEELEELIQNDDLEGVRKHLINGYDPKLLNHRDTTPLKFCFNSDNTEIAKVLIEAKSDVNSMCPIGKWSLLHSATLWESPKCMKLLLQFKANPNVQCNDEGRTPLHYSVLDNTGCTQILLGNGADYSIRDITNRTALCQAITHNNPKGAALLLDAGAKLDYGGRYPPWLRELLTKRKNIKNVLITFFALSKKTKGMIHKDLVREIANMIWETRDEEDWFFISPEKKIKK